MVVRAETSAEREVVEVGCAMQAGEVEASWRDQ